MTEGPERLRLLETRVRWLDRYRRAVGICAALASAPLIWFSLAPGWPRAHAVGLVIALGVATWWLAEVVLAWFTALWETEANFIAREKGLPRAMIVKRDS
jgi:hypothetical protein